MDIGNILAPLFSIFQDLIGGSILTLLTDLLGQIFSIA
jgi:hypothetical protein